MSDYAAAINHALGNVEPPPPPIPEDFPHPVCKSQIKRLLVQRGGTDPARELDAGISLSGTHCGFLWVVREEGVSGIYPAPGKFGYWQICFYTDEELKLEQPGLNVEVRAEICKRAIERFLAGTPAYTGVWYLRNLKP